MHRAIQWLKYASVIVICLLNKTAATVQCPDGFYCSGPNCHMIYIENGKWIYKDPDGRPINKDSYPVYIDPNCYMIMQVTDEQISCNDAQRECEMVGGNIKVINSVEEYNQLTYIALGFLELGSRSRFNVHVESDLPQKNITRGCAIIDVYDGEGKENNRINSENMDCSTTDMVNAIICESTDKTEICSAPPSQTTKPNISKNKSSAGVVAAFCVPLVVITMVLLIVLFFFRRKKKRRMSSDNKHGIGKGNSHSNDVYVPAHSDDYAEIAAPAETLSDPVRYKDRANAQQHCKDAVMSPSSSAAKPNQVAVGLYDLPNKKKRIDQDFSDTYDTLNASDMTPDTKTDVTGDVSYSNTQELSNDAAMSPSSSAAKPNNVAVGLYALPNKKKRIDQDFSDTYDTLNASDMTPDTKTDIGDVSYVNTEGFSNGDELYNCINAAEVKSDEEGHIQDVPYENTTGTNDDSTNMQLTIGTHIDEKHDDVYSTANEEAQKNEYGKLKTDTPSQTDNMYTYVDMPINSTMSSPEDSTYDCLQRNK